MNRCRELPIFDCRLPITIGLLAAFFVVPILHAGEVYQSVMQELTRHENRLPGSEAYNASIDHLEKTLKAAGLDTHRQTFDTLVPEILECSLTVDGNPVAPVYALGPNGPANNSAGAGKLSGPLVFLGNGTLAEMDGKQVKGCIAVLNFDSPNMMQVFSQGALAVVFVGNGRETQWDVRNQFIDQAFELPRFFVFAENAEAAGLTANIPGRTAEVSLRTRWKDVKGINLWVEIPGEKGARFNFAEEEAVVLSATLDTFGVIPELSPSVRTSANCALLADAIVQIKNEPLKRSVFAVFLGSHYAMQDGARMFYFALETGRAGELDERSKGFLEQQKASEVRLSALASGDLFRQDAGVLKDLIVRIEKRLSGKVDNMNHELQVVRKKLLPLRRMKTMLPEDQAQMERLQADESAVLERRKNINSLRRDLKNRSIADQGLFAEIVAEERNAIQRGADDAARLHAHNITYKELAGRICPKRVVGHYHIDFADASLEWMLDMASIGDQFFYHTVGGKFAELRLGDYLRNILAVADADSKLGGKGAPGGMFTEPASSMIFPAQFYVPSLRSTPARAAQTVQIFGYQLVNPGDPLNGDAMPYRYEIDLKPLVPRLSGFVSAVANDPGLSMLCPLARPSRHKDAVIHFRREGGLRFMQFARGGATLDGVPDDGVVFCSANRSEFGPAVAGHSHSASSRILASGHIFIPLLYMHVRFYPFAYQSDGVIRYAPRRQRWDDPRLIYASGNTVTAPMVPGGFGSITGTLLDGRTDSAMPMFLEQAPNCFAFYAAEVESFKMFEKGGVLLLGSSEAEPRGLGVALGGAPLYAMNVLNQTAHDYLYLNKSRLQILRDKNIMNDSLESLHADAESYLQDAVDSRDRSEVSKAVAYEIFSSGISARVAPALREITNDMVRAVVLLLVLTLPFAFIMERLFISATSIYRQVLGFVGFFAGSFILMYMVHPAFQIATSPLIIFLAFIIILLSALVIQIVMSKFKKELRAMQGLSSSAHGVASDSSTSLAAVLIGISGMRNRPLKTFLTAVTIVLLTFAIVVFASFTSAIGVAGEYQGKGEGPGRIELHRHSSLGMPRMLYECLASLYSKDWAVFAREGFFRGPQVQAEGDLLVVMNEGSRKWQRLSALVGFDPGEMKYNSDLARALPGFAEYSGSLPPLYLAERAAELLEAKTGDRLLVGGKAFQFAGVLDAASMDRMEYMDRSKLMPPDFESSIKEISADDGSAVAGDLSKDEFVDTTRFTYSSARAVGVTVAGAMKEFSSHDKPVYLNAIMMYAGDGADVDDTANEVAKMFPGPVMAKSSSGVMKYFFSNSIQASGFAVVIVPLLLGGLIIFNSLLGSIVERQKEIFTYSAMGLAPPSVGALFFAESGVYAILGGMGGYFVSQIVAKLVAVGGELGWFVPPEMNFSSLSSVLTSFVVMGMVMISTIYPAVKAGRSANPGVARKWKMPAPVDGAIDFVFPFTVSANDMGGILAFIGEHFENHADASMGSFSASHVRLFKTDAAGGSGLSADIALAPFDLGVMQEFSMRSRPSEIEDIDEVVVRLKKVSGTDGAWLRGTRVFVTDLREQFLLWRSLPVATVMHYRANNERFEAAVASESGQHVEKQ